MADFYPYDKDPVLQGIDKEVFQNSILFTFMTRGNDIYHEFLNYLVRQARLFEKFSLALVQNSWRPATEELFNMGLESKCDWVMIMDTDIGLRHDTTARLMTNDKDIVASPLYFYDPASNDIHLNVHYTPDLAREYTPRMPDGGIEKVLATAFGSVLVKHRVLETFAQAKESFCTWSDFISEEYKNASPDTIFFLKAKEFGFQTWMDWRIPIGTHHKYCHFNSTLAERHYVHRWFDITFGPDSRAKAMQTPEGREKLKTALQHHYAGGAVGRIASDGDSPDKPKVEGEASPATGHAVCEEPSEIHGDSGKPVPVAADTGSHTRDT